MTQRLAQTPWQTVGPFFHYALPSRGEADLIANGGESGSRADLIPEGHDRLGATSSRDEAAGEIIEIVGQVFDGAGQPTPDALVEIWQANAAGRYASAADTRDELPIDANFTGLGRCATGADGGFRFRTLKPGQVPGPGNRLQAPHLAVSVLGRGILKRLVTRIYFENEPSNAEDPVLALVPEARRSTLLARQDRDTWRFDVRLQGEAETVFFEF